MSSSLRIKIQRMGGFLSSMVMPNIGAFIAWGLVTSFVIPTGWTPNEYLCKVVGPTIIYLLPILIGYTGGYNVYGKRGGVAGAIATMGVVVGAEIPMFIGAMIMGPLGAFIIKKIDKLFEGKVKSGMEMMVDNFSLGIAGALMLLFGYQIVKPILDVLLVFLSGGVKFLIDRHLLPFTSIFVNPAQILFLNNAVNHGVMGPIGVQQVAETGKSILFLVEANVGTWFGLMLAFCVFGKGIAKKAAPAATFILFFGGIGEVAFPYALMKPVTILGPMLANTVSLFILQSFDGGTVGPVSPGSFPALLMMSPKGSMIVNIIACAAATIVSFLVVSFFLMRDKSEVDEESERQSAELVASNQFTGMNFNTDIEVASALKGNNIKKVVFACDAGMGSSAMGVSILQTKLRKAMLNMNVVHVSVNDIPEDADLIITNKVLEGRAKQAIKEKDIPILTISNFLDGNEYDVIVKYLKNVG